ncbi:MAG: PTS sugar transporter subunit IIA [Hyphomicrobiaceae bacterium]
MDIQELLSPKGIFLDVPATDKPTLLRELARRAEAGTPVPAERILAELVKREDLGSTGVGNGLAIPHVRLAEVARPTALFVRLQRPIDFDAVDGQGVDLVVLLVLPNMPKLAQSALASVAKAFRDPRHLEHVRQAANARAVLDALAADDR